MGKAGEEITDHQMKVLPRVQRDRFFFTNFNVGIVWRCNANIWKFQAAEKGMLSGSEDPTAGHCSMEAALQTALHCDQEIGRGSRPQGSQNAFQAQSFSFLEMEQILSFFKHICLFDL